MTKYSKDLIARISTAIEIVMPTTTMTFAVAALMQRNRVNAITIEVVRITVAHQRQRKSQRHRQHIDLHRRMLHQRHSALPQCTQVHGRPSHHPVRRHTPSHRNQQQRQPRRRRRRRALHSNSHSHRRSPDHRSAHCNSNTNKPIIKLVNTQPTITTITTTITIITITTIISILCHRQRPHSHVWHSQSYPLHHHSITTTMDSVFSRMAKVAASSITKIRSTIIKRQVRSSTRNQFINKASFSIPISRQPQQQPPSNYKAAHSMSIGTRPMFSSKISCHFWIVYAPAAPLRRQRKCQQPLPFIRNKLKSLASLSTKIHRISNIKISSASTRRSSSASTHRRKTKIKIDFHRPKRVVDSNSNHSPKRHVSSNSVVFTTTSTITCRRTNTRSKINTHQHLNNIGPFSRSQQIHPHRSTISSSNRISIVSHPLRWRQPHWSNNTSRTSNITISNVKQHDTRRQLRPVKENLHTIHRRRRSSRLWCPRNTTRRPRSNRFTSMWPNKSTTTWVRHSNFSRTTRNRRLLLHQHQLHDRYRSYRRHQPPISTFRNHPTNQPTWTWTMVNIIRRQSTKMTVNIIPNCMRKISHVTNWRINANRNWRNSNIANEANSHRIISMEAITKIIIKIYVAHRTIWPHRVTKSFWIQLIRRTLRPVAMNYELNRRPSIRPASPNSQRHHRKHCRKHRPFHRMHRPRKCPSSSHPATKTKTLVTIMHTMTRDWMMRSANIPNTMSAISGKRKNQKKIKFSSYLVKGGRWFTRPICSHETVMHHWFYFTNQIFDSAPSPSPCFLRPGHHPNNSDSSQWRRGGSSPIFFSFSPHSLLQSAAPMHYYYYYYSHIQHKNHVKRSYIISSSSLLFLLFISFVIVRL